MNVITKIKSSKIVNSGFIKKLKDKIYFKYIAPNNEAKTDKYRKEILNKIFKIFINKQWCLGSGSLLRYYRDNTMDGQDLDIYILLEDFEQIKNDLFLNGFKLKQVFLNNKDKICEYKFEYKGVEVDIFIVYKINDAFYYSFTLEGINSKGLKKVIEQNKVIITGKDYISYNKKLFGFEKLKKYKFNDAYFITATNIPLMLEGMYDTGWKVYDPQYDPRKGPENNVPVEEYNSKSILYIKPLSNFEQN